MLMHLAIALVTYNCLVHVAPVRPAAHPHHRGGQPATEPKYPGPDRHAGRRR
jgi:hypothetical protein